MLEFKFEDAVLSPEKWFDKAEELKYAADILLDFEKNRTRFKREYRKNIIVDTNIYLTSQIIMLNGFAIENLLKALMCKRNKITIDEKGQVKGLDHDVVSLAQTLEIDLEKNETVYLEKVFRHIVWEGKYPSPLKKKKFTEEWTTQNINQWHNTYVRDYDFEIVKVIYNKILAQVEIELFR